MYKKGTVLAAVLLVMALLVSCGGAPAVTEFTIEIYWDET